MKIPRFRNRGRISFIENRYSLDKAFRQFCKPKASGNMPRILSPHGHDKKSSSFSLKCFQARCVAFTPQGAILCSRMRLDGSRGMINPVGLRYDSAPAILIRA